MNDEISLGEKIRAYRKRANLSQFDLELEINAAQGMISRIENNSVRPTKETLSKISTVLKLKPSEVVDLLDLNILTTEELILAINSLSSSLELDEVLQTAVDIMFDLYPNYNGGVILLFDFETNSLNSRTVSNMPKIEFVHKFLPKRLTEYYISLNAKDSLIADSYINLRNNESNILHNFSKGAMSDWIADRVSKILSFKYGISMPLIYLNEPIGVVLYTKRILEPFTEYEQKALGLLNEQIAIAIKNAEKFEELKSQLKHLKTEK